MEKVRSERYALAALIALVVYGLACVFPAAWSPDSSSVIFPVFGEEGIERLVLTDPSGTAIREVARVDPEKAALSPAAWSPDGKWIAYMKLEETPDGRAFSLMRQEPRSGKERCILKESVAEEEAWEINQYYGPQWVRGSKSLAVARMVQEVPEVAVVDMKGKVQQQIPLVGDLAQLKWAVSPDGRYLAYVDRVAEEKRVRRVVIVRDLRSDADKQITLDAGPEGPGESEIGSQGEAMFCPRPVWSADSRSLYFGAVEGDPDDKPVGLVKQFTVETGETRTVWKREGALAASISLSTQSGRLALDTMTDDEVVGIEVVRPASGEATPIHFESGLCHYSTSISPDGKWVALCLGNDEEPETFVGAMISSDGASLRFFVPDAKRGKLIPDIVRNRLEAALETLPMEEYFQKADIASDGPLSEADLKRALELLDRIAEEKKAPLFGEAIAYAKVAFSLQVLENNPPAERARLAQLARDELGRFMAAYPNHPLAAELQGKIDELLKQDAQEQEAAPADAE